LTVIYFPRFVQFSSSAGAAVSQDFRWRIARGKHLFPFRTEQLSPSAPMVLGGQPPGRVGRRRFYLRAAPPGGPFLCTNIPGARGVESREASCDGRCLVAGADELGGAPRVLGKAIRSPPPRPALRLLRDGLEPVLAEGGEVDHQVGRVGKPPCELSSSFVHGGEPMFPPGRKPWFAGVLACQARMMRSASPPPEAVRRGGDGGELVGNRLPVSMPVGLDRVCDRLLDHPHLGQR
jgi:hypothetical protein